MSTLIDKIKEKRGNIMLGLEKANKKQQVKVKCITLKRGGKDKWFRGNFILTKKQTPTDEKYLMGRGKYYSILFNLI